MSGVSIVGFAVNGLVVAGALGSLLALDPAEAAARNERIRRLTCERRNRRAALESARLHAADERERLALSVVTARVDAGLAAAALARARLPVDLRLRAPDTPDETWCHTVEAVVRAAYAQIQGVTAERALRQLTDLLAATARPAVSAADVLGPTGPGPAPVDDGHAVLARMLATLDPRAAVADRDVVDAAAQAAAARQDRAAHLVQLRVRIQQANDRARARHDDALVAAALLDAIEPYDPAHGLDPRQLAHARQALAEVVTGHRVLDDPLLDLVEELRLQVEAQAAARSVTDSVADVLGEMGYQVGPDFSVGEASEGMLEISHPGQPAHLVRMRVDSERRQLIARVYRAAGDGSEKADTEAEAAWCGALDRAIARLAGDGVALTPVLLTQPGSKPTPAAAVTRSESQQASARTRQRTHQRPER